MNATPKVVLSTDSSYDVSAWENSTLAAGGGVDQVRRLKASSGGSLVTFGGVHTVRSLVAANLVDEYWLRAVLYALSNEGFSHGFLLSRKGGTRGSPAALRNSVSVMAPCLCCGVCTTGGPPRSAKPDPRP
jgi:dihydrofolate reductase